MINHYKLKNVVTERNLDSNFLRFATAAILLPCLKSLLVPCNTDHDVKKSIYREADSEEHPFKMMKHNVTCDRVLLNMDSLTIILLEDVLQENSL